MELLYHGGKCCGVKTLEGFWNSPKDQLQPLDSPRNPGGMSEWCWESRANSDKHGHDVRSDVPFYHEQRPKETAVERLDAYLEHLVKVRPEGMVEALLVASQWRSWHKTLIERNFHVSCEFKNSNSGELIRCYQLLYGESNEARRPKVKKPRKSAVKKDTAVAPPLMPVFLSEQTTYDIRLYP